MSDQPPDRSEEDRDGPKAPLADLAEQVEERREEADPIGVDALFEEPPFDAVEADSLWGEVGGAADSAFGAVGRVAEAGERADVVSKRSFCERCRHFSAPPEARCTHDGTDILEFVDKDQVRVRDCPVVEERGLAKDEPLG